MKETFYTKYGKRALDILCSGAALIVLSPVLGITAILVKKKLGSPVIFAQERPGKDEKIFKLYKFRSMTDERDENGNLLHDDLRQTPFGQKIRDLSIDELPELWNIFTGNMSVIGPRPLLVKYLPRYSEEQHHRHDVKPGLSGWAQVNGRNLVSWEDKFKMDVWYTKNVSFLLDAKIVFMTIGKIFKREGITSETSSTMEEFLGTEANK